MVSRIAADFLLLIHSGFIVFVVLGGLLVLKWRRVLFLHLPAVVWGALIEFQGWVCPLTPYEQHLRQAAGQEGYSGGFIEHYLLPLIYPEALNRDLQLVLGTAVLVINLGVYGWVWVLGRRNSKTGPGHGRW